MRTQGNASVAAEDVLMVPQEAAGFLRVSISWLAKARMTGEGPPFLQIGRSVRYSKDALIRWIKLQQRISTRD